MNLDKRGVFLLALLPLLWISWLAFHNTLGANPVERVIHFTGLWTLYFLLITLSITPLRRLLGWNALLRIRRMLGLFAFFYGTLHLLSYAGIDQWFTWQAIIHDIVKHPYILIGVSGYVLMLPLALTSNAWAVSKLKARWKQLHRLAYVVPALGVLHFAWLVKKDMNEPLLYGALLLVLLALRLRLFSQWRFSR